MYSVWVSVLIILVVCGLKLRILLFVMLIIWWLVLVGVLVMVGICLMSLLILLIDLRLLVIIIRILGCVVMRVLVVMGFMFF